MANQTKQKTDIKEVLKTYFKSVKLEWGKITWPPKQQVIVETIYVVVIVAVFTIGVLALDTIFQELFKFFKLSH